MTRPKILLVPQFTELEWTIGPRLAEWAEIATFDAPGVGDEPMPDDLYENPRREVIVERGLLEVDSNGWERFFVIADGRGTATAVEIAMRRPEAVPGLALGHATLSYDTDGDRAPVNGAVYEAMGQLLRGDYESFVSHGITQMTQGSYDEKLARKMLDRFPSMEVAAKVWESLGAVQEPIGGMLGTLDKPLLFAQHNGCIAFNAEGFEDAVAAFPQATVVGCEKGPSSDPAFAEALREFCGRYWSG